MTDYVKSTNFASKDSLATGNPLKIVKGTEIDTEFTNIAVAIATKADLNSPTFLGTPLLPSGTTATTQPTGTNTTQVATTAFVQAALQAVYPVGSVYINAASTTNPATLLGFGTWAEFGAGRVLVGQNASDVLFDTLEETGGSKDAIVVSHSHDVSDSGHRHDAGVRRVFDSASGRYGTASDEASILSPLARYPGSEIASKTDWTSTAGSGVSVNSTGSSGTNANLQPYIVVKMWKRTA